MKPLKDAMGQIIAAMSAAESNARALTVPTPRPASGYPEPVLPPELQAQVDAIGGTRFVDRAGDAMTVNVEPGYHPEAAHFAAEQRLALLPAPENVIRKWYELVTSSLSLGSGNPEAMVDAVLLVCGDYPAKVWSRENARAILRDAGDFSPSASKINAVLQPVADAMKARLDRLERIAKTDPSTAGRFRAGPARESTVPYPVQPPPDRKARVVIGDKEETAEEPPIDVEAMIAALGVTPDQKEAAQQEFLRRNGLEPKQ